MSTKFPRFSMLESRYLSVCLALAVTVSVVGCGSEFGATATGTVTLDGNPITPGLVTFAPSTSGEVPASGKLDDNGRFELKTKKSLGLKPGDYQVAIQAFEPPDVPKGQRSFEPSKPLVPEKYMQTKTSGLKYTVEPGGNTIDIELTSDSE